MALKTAYRMYGLMDPSNSKLEADKTLEVALTASVNDFAGFTSGYSVYKLKPSAAVNITGIAALAADGIIWLDNRLGSYAVTLKHQSSSSAADNRITCTTGADIVIAAGSVQGLFYDLATKEWTDVVELPVDANGGFKIPVTVDGTVLVLGGKKWLARHLSNGPAGASTGTVAFAYGVNLPTIDYNGNTSATRRSNLITNGLTCKVQVPHGTTASAIYAIAASAAVTVQFEPEW